METNLETKIQAIWDDKTQDTCYRCGKTGHWLRDCTIPKGKYGKRGSKHNPIHCNYTQF